ncbi:ribulose-phosphate 3-epimerase [Ruminococcaceae bacterium OttesenSCG-928-I18]|nr:ribulose-phosphate 3-epimerase [Ruminococcaceae bacterium OttesenSCG-928-I18]
MDVWTKRCLLSPSLICLDLCNLESQVHELEEAGIEVLHIDIIDGHFSESMPLGLETVRQLRRITPLPFDVHLMASQQDYFIKELLDIGVQQLVFHAEAAPHVDGLLNTIHGAGVRAGVALKPSTPLCTLEYVLEKCDVVLLMLINPGYASSAAETQVPYAERKIRELRRMIEERNLPTRIEVDGRISRGDIEKYGDGLVDIFVTGSTCLNRSQLGQSAGALLSSRKNLLEGGAE